MVVGGLVVVGGAVVVGGLVVVDGAVVVVVAALVVGDGSGSLGCTSDWDRSGSACCATVVVDVDASTAGLLSSSGEAEHPIAANVSISSAAASAGSRRLRMPAPPVGR